MTNEHGEVTSVISAYDCELCGQHQVCDHWLEAWRQLDKAWQNPGRGRKGTFWTWLAGVEVAVANMRRVAGEVPK